MKTLEHDEQVLLFSWAALNEERIPELKNLFAVPNGEYRPISTAKRLKASGVRAGVPDMFLAFPSGGFFGLFIELKVGKNKTTPSQNEWITRLQQAGYMVVVCYGYEAAKREILDYLGESGEALRMIEECLNG